MLFQLLTLSFVSNFAIAIAIKKKENEENEKKNETNEKKKKREKSLEKRIWEVWLLGVEKS